MRDVWIGQLKSWIANWRPVVGWQRIARRAFLSGLVTTAIGASISFAQAPGRGEATPPDVSAPVVGEFPWAEQQPTYVAQAPALPAEYNANFEQRMFNAWEVRNIVREELMAYEQAQQQEAAEGHIVGSDLGMTASWNHGLEVATRNKDFRVHVGGRTQFDVGWFSADQNIYNPAIPGNTITNEFADGVDFRRARLRVDGTMYEVIDFACEYDFVNATRVRNAADTGFVDHPATAPTDVYLQFKELPVVGNCRIGNHKEAIGFEHLVSSRFLPFMERSFNHDAFYGGLFNGFSPGISFFNTIGEDELGTWNIGVFKPTSNVFAFTASDGDYTVTARTTRLLWYVDDGRGLLHVGASARQSTSVNDQQVFRVRAPVRTGIFTMWPTPANTGVLFGDDMQFINGELVGVYGSWTFQSEYLVSGFQDARATAAAAPLGNATYHGGYVQLLYYLTGEHDNYNKKTGTFDRVIPNENFFRVRDDYGGICRGTGAWQVGARYNYLDLNDLGLDGGILHDVTAGVNWFLNPNAKLQFNYSAMYRDAPLPAGGGDGWIHSWGSRLAFDF